MVNTLYNYYAEENIVYYIKEINNKKKNPILLL